MKVTLTPEELTDFATKQKLFPAIKNPDGSVTLELPREIYYKLLEEVARVEPEIKDYEARS